MRTTIELPDDLHQQAMSIARDTSKTLSEVVALLMRRGLEQGAPEADVSHSPRTGLPTVTLGTILTTEDVRALEDED